MPAYLQIYCIYSEYTGLLGKNPLFDIVSIYNILVDKSKIGAIKSDETKIFPIESGTHQISISIWSGRSSPQLNVEVQEGMTIDLVCGLGKKSKLFIDRDLPSSAVVHRVEEESLQNNGNVYRPSIRMLGAIISVLLWTFITLEIVANLHIGAGQWALVLFLSCLSVYLIALGISWIYRKIICRSK